LHRSATPIAAATSSEHNTARTRLSTTATCSQGNATASDSAAGSTSIDVDVAAASFCASTTLQQQLSAAVPTTGPHFNRTANTGGTKSIPGTQSDASSSTTRRNSDTDFHGTR
jgi:hypothetical protein